MQRENNGLEGGKVAFPVAARSGSMRAGYIANLNAQQQDAVEHGTERPLLIIAGAGSGKTNTLAHRVAHQALDLALG
jgi:DNA helicase-2/ATP-dependent DNA helicase PcrA